LSSALAMKRKMRKICAMRTAGCGMLLCMSTFEPPPEQLEACATRPMGRALRLLGDAPTLLIIFSLLHGTRRFGALRMTLGDVSPKTIAQRLRLLEELGFVRRRAFAEIPPRVEYDLTEKGFALADIMQAIRAFGERYLADDSIGASGVSTDQEQSSCT
jgi:DNA-binding HxlR family transcriptional regulator